MSQFESLNALKGNRQTEEQGEGRGIVSDVAVQTIGGIRDASQSVLNITGDLASWLEEKVPLGSIGTSGYSEEFNTLQLPEVDSPDTLTGGLVRGGTQFAVGFVPAFRMLKALGTGTKAASAATALGFGPRISAAVGTGATAELAGLLADQVVFDPYDHRLSNMIEEIPALKNPVTEYLASDPDDTESEARLKIALEGLGLGAIFGSMIPLVRKLRTDKSGRDLDRAFEAAMKAEEANVKVKTERAAKGLTPEDVLEETPQGNRPFVNNKHLDTPEEIKNTLNATTKFFAENIDEARRGRMAEEQTMDLAQRMGMTVDELTKRRKGEAFNAEQALAARMLLNKTADDLTRLAKLAADPKTNTENIQFAFRKASARHAAVMEQVMGIAAEAGRALRQFQIAAGTLDKSKAIKHILQETGWGHKTPEVIEMVAKLDTPEGLAIFNRALHKPKMSDHLLEAWINGLLSGPATQAVNIVSNSLVATLSVPETLLAATMSMGKGKGNRVYFREAFARTYGLVQGMKEGLVLGYKTFLTEEPSDVLTKIETNKYQSIPSWTLRRGVQKKEIMGMPIPLTGQIELGGKQVRIPGRLLQAGDEFFKAIGYRQELNALAMRSGIDKGLKGKELAEHIERVLRNPPEDIRLKSVDNARYQTFTRSLGETGVKIQGFAASHPAAKIPMPFIRTPVNIVKFAGERSPLGFFMKDVRKALRAGGAQRATALSRITIGSGIAVTVSSLVMDGVITGGGPKDPALRSTLYDSGWQPYSILVGDTYYSYSRLEPIGMLFGVAADATEIWQNADEVEADEIGAMVVGSIMKNLTSKTWLRGVSELMLAQSDPERYGPRYIQRLAGTLIPTGVAQAARVNDPLLREATSIIDAIKSRIPGQSTDLLPVRNVWGDPVSLGGGLGPDILSPVYTSVINKDPVSQEVARLRLGLQKPERTIRGIRLSDEQYDRYVQISGQTAKKIVRRYVTAPGWARVPDDMKKDLINGAMVMSRRIARTQILPELAPQMQEQMIQRAESFLEQ
jgi:hypothetical protein